MTIILPIGFWFGDLTVWYPLSVIRRHRRCCRVVPGQKEVHPGIEDLSPGTLVIRSVN